MANVVRGSALAAAVVAGAGFFLGCGEQASLSFIRGTLKASTAVKHSSKAAWFSVGARGRQTILLAFQPTGAQPPPAGPSIGRGDQEPAKPPMQYRAYLKLEVQKGGGDFTIGQPILGGRVRAFYWAYNERDELVMVLPDRFGTIRTEVWPLIGGPAVDDWWVTGRFELLMANDVRLNGSFTARPAPAIVERFDKDRRL